MSRKKESDESLVGGGLPEDQVTAAQQLAELEAKLAIKRQEVIEEQAAAQAAWKKKVEEQRNKEFANRLIPVLIQQRRDRPVRFGNVIFECRTPLLVNRRELRHLEGLRSQGRIQLIVGELLPKGEVQVYLRDSAAERLGVATKKNTEG